MKTQITFHIFFLCTVMQACAADTEQSTKAQDDIRIQKEAFRKLIIEPIENACEADRAVKLTATFDECQKQWKREITPANLRCFFDLAKYDKGIREPIFTKAIVLELLYYTNKIAKLGRIDEGLLITDVDLKTLAQNIQSAGHAYNIGRWLQDFHSVSPYANKIQLLLQNLLFPSKALEGLLTRRRRSCQE